MYNACRAKPGQWIIQVDNVSFFPGLVAGADLPSSKGDKHLPANRREAARYPKAYQPVEEMNLVDVSQRLSDYLFALRQIQFLNFLPVLKVSIVELGSVRDVREAVLV